MLTRTCKKGKRNIDNGPKRTVKEEFKESRHAKGGK
jgi:hypothetical protein